MKWAVHYWAAISIGLNNSCSRIIYQAMGFKREMFTVLFAIPRTAGWLAQWQEVLPDPFRFVGHTEVI
jgi:citrate synthase